MSTQAAKQFLEKVAGDQALQGRLATAGDRTRWAGAVVDLGRQHGFTFTGDDVASVVKAELKAGDGTMDDRQLAQVAGGLSTFRYWLGKAWDALGGGSGGTGGGQGTTGVRG